MMKKRVKPSSRHCAACVEARRFDAPEEFAERVRRSKANECWGCGKTRLHPRDVQEFSLSSVTR